MVRKTFLRHETATLVVLVAAAAARFLAVRALGRLIKAMLAALDKLSEATVLVAVVVVLTA
jgi:hypothetical protein